MPHAAAASTKAISVTRNVTQSDPISEPKLATRLAPIALGGGSTKSGTSPSRTHASQIPRKAMPTAMGTTTREMRHGAVLAVHAKTPSRKAALTAAQ